MIPWKLGAALILLFALTFAVLVWIFAQPAEPLPVLGSVPDFRLTNQEGGEVTLASFSDGPWVCDFFFTSCAGPCPKMTEQMAELTDTLRDAEVKFVSFTVDPETDTPERLKQYGFKYDADFTRWSFLTGSQETLSRLAVEGFKLGSIDDPVIHSTRFIVVDGDGRIRRYVSGLEEETVPALKEAVERLLEEH